MDCVMHGKTPFLFCLTVAFAQSLRSLSSFKMSADIAVHGLFIFAELHQGFSGGQYSPPPGVRVPSFCLLQVSCLKFDL